MWNRLEKALRNKLCESTVNCYLKRAAEQNKILHQELSYERDWNRNLSLLCKFLDNNNEVIYLNPTPKNNGIISVSQKFRDADIVGLDLHGIFMISSVSQSTLQEVNLVFDTNKNNVPYCRIQDFKCGTNKGYGTIMMNCLLKHIKNYNIAYVSGWISPVDTHEPEHSARLHHFYSKFGFKFYKDGLTEYIRSETRK